MGRATDYLCEADTVIIGRKGSINNPVFVGEPFWNVDTAFGLVANRSLLLPKYLYYFCVKFDFTKLNTTVTIPSLTKANLLKVKIPLPSLPEQKRIAAVLDKICEMKRNVEARLQKLDLLVKSRFVEMFGDVVHKPKFSCKTLGEIAAVGSSKRIFQSEYVNQGVPFYRSKEVVELSKGEEITTSLWISRERFEEIKTRFGVPSKGDLLVTAVGTIGQIWIVDGASEFYYKDGNLMCIHPGVHLDSVYLREALIRLIADYKMTMPQGTAYAAFTIEMARKLQLPLPPIGEQRQFAAFVVEVDKSKFVLRETLSRMETLYRAKLQEYFG